MCTMPGVRRGRRDPLQVLHLRSPSGRCRRGLEMLPSCSTPSGCTATSESNTPHSLGSPCRLVAHNVGYAAAELSVDHLRVRWSHSRFVPSAEAASIGVVFRVGTSRTDRR